MSLIFYHIPNSTSAATSAVLAELEHNLPFPLCTRILLSLQAGDTKTPSFLSSVNPNGRVPAIVHDGVPIWESAAITMYLGETFGAEMQHDDDDCDCDGGNRDGHPLYPRLGPARGEAMKWIVWTNVTMAEAAGRLAAALPTGAAGAVETGSTDWVPEKDDEDDDEDHRKGRDKAVAMQKATADLELCLTVLNTGLEGRSYLLSGGYCLADTHVWTFVRWIGLLGVEVGPWGNVRGWMERVGARPALQKEISE